MHYVFKTTDAVSDVDGPGDAVHSFEIYQTLQISKVQDNF